MLKRFIDDSSADQEFKEVQYAKLDRMWEFASANDCRTNVVLNYFGEYKTTPCGHCDNCINPPKSIDGTVIAQKAISAVIRCEENAPMNLLIDVLRGSYRAEVRDRGYDQIKTFGVGKDISFINWKLYITQLLNQGFLKIDYTEQFKIKTTPISHQVLFENKKVQLVDLQYIESEVVKEKPVKSVSKKEQFENDLMQKLKEWRTKLAHERNVPSYVIFPDKVFESIVKTVPLTINDLASVEGIGKVKLEQYGQDLLAVIQGYTMEQNHKSNVKGQTYLETMQLLKHGNSISDIAKTRNLSEITIYSHIAYLYTKNEEINIFEYISKNEVDAVNQAWLKANKVIELAAIAEHLQSPLDFSKIRLCLAVVIKREKNGSENN